MLIRTVEVMALWGGAVAGVIYLTGVIAGTWRLNAAERQAAEGRATGANSDERWGGR